MAGGGFESETKTSLEEVLAFRETKARRQRALLAELKTPLLCLGLNMPGEYKRFFLARCSFHEELRITRLSLEAERIAAVHEEVFEGPGGYAAFISASADPEKLKAISVMIEDTHPLGRLFDIDVLRPEGEKISRGKARPCLICGGDAFVCGRSRAHGAEEPQNAALGLMTAFRRERLADLTAAAAQRALLSEAAITPKPGLVDRTNNGAHRDMDFFSFIDSTAALVPYFRSCALSGFDAACLPPEKLTEGTEIPPALFKSLRPGGKIAEIEMRAASGGANTHRGLIFSMGLASAAFGVFFRYRENVSAGDLLAFTAAMTCNIADDFGRNGEELSHGEAIHRRYGIGGAREEARKGFPAVRGRALPVLRRYLAEGRGLNEAGIAALLHLLAAVADTNIIHRAGPETLEAIQKDAAAFLSADPSIPAMTEYAAKLDKQFIEQNISPGGCADLLALSLFLHWLTQSPP